MEKEAFQDQYLDKYSHCFGCGKLNEHGLHIKSYWDGDESICVFQPHPYHTTGVKGFVFGGIIASAIDCHSAGTAAAATYRAEGRAFGSEPSLRFVTASLHVNFLKPTPIDKPIVLRSRIKEIKETKVVVETDVFSGDVLCVKGQLVAVRIPNTMES
jgi:acyl-coenzyme A thioesterase PaaI-like protein